MSEKQIIAVVDDDASILSGVSSLVRSLGFIALTFASAEAVLAYADLQAVSCLVSDIQMPGGLDGFELVDALRARHLGVPIVLMTGMVCDAVRSRALASGVLAFLRKPIDGDALATLLEARLRLAGGEVSHA